LLDDILEREAEETIRQRALRDRFELGYWRRFATAEELFEITALLPRKHTAVWPPVLPVQLYADPAVGAGTGRIAFNAGSLTVSITMDAGDWRSLASPVESRFCSGNC
jgi:hypothetical protein